MRPGTEVKGPVQNAAEVQKGAEQRKTRPAL